MPYDSDEWGEKPVELSVLPLEELPLGPPPNNGVLAWEPLVSGFRKNRHTGVWMAILPLVTRTCHFPVYKTRFGGIVIAISGRIYWIKNENPGAEVSS